MLTFCKRNVKEGAKKRVENLHVSDCRQKVQLQEEKLDLF